MSLEPGILFVGIMFMWLVYALMSEDGPEKDIMDDEPETNKSDEEQSKKKEGKKNV